MSMLVWQMTYISHWGKNWFSGKVYCIEWIKFKTASLQNVTISLFIKINEVKFKMISLLQTKRYV